MSLPKVIENSLTPSTSAGKSLAVLGFTAFVIGAPFLLRTYTIDHLTLWTKAQNVTALAILPEDGFRMEHRMADILALKEVRERMQEGKKYLVYFIPQDYIMQGMIADTGGNWKLFNRHHSMAMITDWIFNPFGHLREGHHAMHGGMHMQHLDSPTGVGGVSRRLIFLSIEVDEVKTPADFFGINVLRVPQFMIDIDIHNMDLLAVKDLPHGSGWGTVPTPML